MWKRIRSCCFYACKIKSGTQVKTDPVGPKIDPVGPKTDPVEPKIDPVEPKTDPVIPNPRRISPFSNQNPQNISKTQNDLNQQKLNDLNKKYNITNDIDELVSDDIIVNSENALNESLKDLDNFVNFKIEQSRSCPPSLKYSPFQKAYISKRKKSENGDISISSYLDESDIRVVITNMIEGYRRYTNNLKIQHEDQLDYEMETNLYICKTFKDFYNEYKSDFADIGYELDDIETQLCDHLNIHFYDEISFFEKVNREDPIRDYIFHYTTLSNLCSIVIDGYIYPYNFLNHGKGVYFHKIGPNYSDNYLRNIIYENQTAVISNPEKVRYAIAIKETELNKKVTRISQMGSIFKANKKVVLSEDVSSVIYVIRKANI